MLKYATVEEKITVGDDPFADLVVRQTEFSPNKLFYRDDARGVWLYQANYISCQVGKMVKVDKGALDKSQGA